MNNQLPTRKIFIPATDVHYGMLGIELETEWKCLTCGSQRGEPVKGVSFDGSLPLSGVDMWLNPCGHKERYSDVRNHEMKKFYPILINQFKEGLIAHYGENCMNMHIVCTETWEYATMEQFLMGELNNLRKTMTISLSFHKTEREAEMKTMVDNMVRVFSQMFAFIQ